MRVIFCACGYGSFSFFGGAWAACAAGGRWGPVRGCRPSEAPSALPPDDPAGLVVSFHSHGLARKGFPYPTIPRGLRGCRCGSFLATLGDLPARRAMPVCACALNTRPKGAWSTVWESLGWRQAAGKSTLRRRTLVFNMVFCCAQRNRQGAQFPQSFVVQTEYYRQHCFSDNAWLLPGLRHKEPSLYVAQYAFRFSSSVKTYIHNILLLNNKASFLRLYAASQTLSNRSFSVTAHGGIARRAGRSPSVARKLPEQKPRSPRGMVGYGKPLRASPWEWKDTTSPAGLSGGSAEGASEGRQPLTGPLLPPPEAAQTR